ncbi:type II toxin-antitoxin system Phd/YefM family antitoxin [Candidatus Poriferisocius sp.]|uniref:type II toxin-antitoxin system Phd/YefM family antitoxin n=1 Tax=Candidatus Poriferisocius sp. TaxID=3101276 RepID=UPI003B020EEC
MSDLVNVHEAKTHLSRLLERAHNGEEIILAKAGKPYARLMPLAPSGPRRCGQLAGLVVGPEFFEPLPEEELAAWEGAYSGE